MKEILNAVELFQGDKYIVSGNFIVQGSSPTDAILNLLNQHASYDGMTGRVHRLVTQGPSAHELAEQERMQLKWDKWVEGFKAALAKGEAWALDPVKVQADRAEHMGSDFEPFVAFIKARKEGTLDRVVLGEPYRAIRPPMSQTGYHQILNLTLPISQWVWMLVYRALPPKKIAHIDGNKFNNRIENLKPFVSRSSLPHQCVVLYNGKQHHLGRYATPAEVEAARAEFLSKQVA